MDTTEKKPITDPVVDVRDEEIKKLREENEKLRITDPVVDVRDEEINRLKKENEKLRKENEQLTDDLSLYKSLYNTVTEQNKSLNARIEAIKQILEI